MKIVKSRIDYGTQLIKGEEYYLLADVKTEHLIFDRLLIVIDEHSEPLAIDPSCFEGYENAVGRKRDKV